MVRPHRTDDYAYIIRRLKEARLEKGLRSTRVSEAIKCQKEYLSAVERGTQKIDAVSLLRLIKLYDKDIDYFLKPDRRCGRR